jgi:hypothetical protein
VDTAEKGRLRMGTRISLDEDLFSLEKRAFFSQVCNLPPLLPVHSTSTKHSADICKQQFQYHRKC